MKPKILFITNLIPYPLDNGGKIKSYNTLKALSKKYDIDMISFVNYEEERKFEKNIKELVRNIHIVQKVLVRSTSKKAFITDYISSLFSMYPYNIKKYYDSRVVKILKHSLANCQYKFIYVDHLPLMVYSKYFKGLPVILDQHNVESLILKRMFETENNPIKRMLGKIEYLKLKNFEITAMKNVDKVIALSREDKNSFEELGADSTKISVLPIHINIDKNYSYKKPESKVNILFLGSMSWYPNQSGIKWFYENVWNHLDKDRFSLYIVGGNPPKFIQDYHNGKDVTVTGYVNDVDDYIQLCHVSIVPLFIGSGQRVKIIESFGKEIPVISTSIGAEGLMYKKDENIIIADSAASFIKELNGLYDNNDKLVNISKKARINFEENYSADLLPSKLDGIFQTIK